MCDKSKKRIKVCLKEPNPLIKKWIANWLAESEVGSKTEKTLKIAMDSIKHYPLPIYQAQECAILNGFTNTLCEYIDKKMKSKMQPQVDGINNMKIYHDQMNQVMQHFKQPQETKEQLSTNVAIITEINRIQKQQQISKQIKSSQTKVDIKKKTNPHKNKEINLKKDDITTSSTLTMAPGKFHIWLLVDTAETTGKNKQILDDTRAFLQYLNVQYEVRRLTLGDFLWIARDEAGHELVLPYIVERKRFDDLSTSIRDGRYHEQKHRLKQCGLSNVIYLAEFSNPDYCGLPLSNLQQALVNTHVHTHFQVIYTKNHKDTIQYLSNFTRILIQQFHNKTLCSSLEKTKIYTASVEYLNNICYLLEFNKFYKDSARNASLTVRELFVQQLMQLHGVSLEKAAAIVEIYATPKLLLNAYETCETVVKAQQLLAHIRFGKSMKQIGIKISEIIYDFYMSDFGAEEKELKI